MRGLPEGLAFLDDRLWVTGQIEATLQSVDAGSGETERVVPIGQLPGDVAAADGRLWVTVRGL